MKTVQCIQAMTAIAVLCTVMLTSCNAEREIEALQEKEEMLSHFKQERLTEDQILQRAADALSMIDKAKTRSERKVKSIEPIEGAGLTRSNSAPSFYVVNYENDGGFAIVNALKAGNPVYAFSDEGSLNISDTIYNRGLARYLKSLSTNSEMRELGADPNPPSGPDSIVTEVIKTIREPLLSQSVQDWDQRNYPVNGNGSVIEANCVATTCAQIMSFYEWPKKYDGITLDWAGIKNGTNPSQIRWLIEQLEHSKNLNVFQGGCYPEETLDRTLVNFGYNKAGNWLYASSNSITNNMYVNNERRPVFCQIVIGRLPDGRVGSYHVFCCDGFISLLSRSYPSNMPEMCSVYEQTYLHVVWGYGRNANGYFLWDNKTLGGEAYQWDTLTPEKWGPYSGLRFITGMTPKN